MKQHITPEQLNELSKEEKKKLRKWLMDKQIMIVQPHYLIPLSIGQMIEFLDENGFEITRHKTESADHVWSVTRGDSNFLFKELCDALWEAVKEILEK